VIFSPFLDSILIFGSAYLLVAWSVHLSFFSGQLFFGQMGLMLVSAYSTGYSLIHGWGLILSILAGVVASCAFAAVFGLLSLKLADFPLAIGSIALAEAFRLGIPGFNVFGGLPGIDVPIVMTLKWALVLVLIAAVGLIYFHRSLTSRYVLAMAKDERAARTFGVRAGRLKMLIMLQTGVLCGLGGAVYGAYSGVVEPTFFSFAQLIQFVTFAVVGGSGVVAGSVVGVLLLWVAPQYGGFLNGWTLLVSAVVGIVILLTLPNGLVGDLLNPSDGRLQRGVQQLRRRSDRADTASPAPATPPGDPMSVVKSDG
jgi:branched-chain amino acid transport system permease protein